MPSLSCAEIIDEIQARTGRTEANEELVDTTWCTRRLNKAQETIIRQIPDIPSLNFSNRSSIDTTGTVRYTINEISVGPDVTTRVPCRITDIWYLDGNDSKQLRYLPPDDFDTLHPDPTHADEAFGKPKHWTQRNNTEIEIYPYCSSGYWDKDLKFVGDYYPLDFTTDSTVSSDISMADELLIQYGVWQAWKAIGNIDEERRARKIWSNPEPAMGEEIGLLEQFKDKATAMPGWSWNLYD